MIVIVACNKCGGLLLAKAENKTRTCPYCGSKVIVERAKRIASAENTQKAHIILQALKMKNTKEQRSKRLSYFEACHQPYASYDGQKLNKRLADMNTLVEFWHEVRCSDVDENSSRKGNKKSFNALQVCQMIGSYCTDDCCYC